MRILLSLVIVLGFSIQYGFSQDATNVKVESADEELIVYYDLEGKPGETYLVKLSFELEDATFIVPESVFGDIGKVLVGPEKKIVWKVYNDIETLSGNVTPLIVVQPNWDIQDKVLPTPEPPKLVEDVFVEEMPGAKKRKSKKIKVGSKFSLGSSSALVNKNENFYDSRFSWDGGLFLRYNISRKLYIQPELSYHRQAFRTLQVSDLYLENSNHYARGSASLGFSPVGGGIYFHGGLYYGLLVGGEEVSQNAQDAVITPLSEYPMRNNIDTPFRKDDLGYQFGGCLNFGRGAFALGVNVTRSFDSILDESYWAGHAERGDITLKNESVHFYIQKSF